MNWEIVEGKWEQLKGSIKSHWGKLTDDDILALNGKRHRLAGKVQERYGVLKDEAEEQIDAWMEKIGPQANAPRPNTPGRH